MERVIAVDLGGTNVRVALVSKTGEIIKKVVARTKTEGRSQLVIADDITEKIRQLTTPQELKEIRGIGISSAGPIDLRKGVLLNPPNISFPSVPLVQPIQESLGLPVYLINDCRAGVLGETSFGAGKGCENVVYIIVPYLKKNIEHYLTVPEILVSTLDGLAPLLGASVVARGYVMKQSSYHSKLNIS
jgi:glucokinase